MIISCTGAQDLDLICEPVGSFATMIRPGLSAPSAR
jgi:hypothetical protein